MLYPIVDRDSDTPPYHVAAQLMTDPLIAQVNALAATRTPLTGKTGEALPNGNARKGSIIWINNDPASKWLYETLVALVVPINFQVFGFEIEGIESLQYTIYDEGGDHYGWHMDGVTGAALGKGGKSRKLSLSIQLSAPDSYEGGDLEFMIGSTKPSFAPRQKGAVILFPSFVLHRVLPVTRGRRVSLVAWFQGPRYR